MKLKIVRIVTATYVVPWHLHNMLVRMPGDFDVYVVGSEVSKNKDIYPSVTFVDININRKINIFADALALFKLARFFLIYKPDIVHSIMPKAGLLSALAGFICRVPLRVHTFTGQSWVANVAISRHIYYWIDRLINLLNTVCLTDSFSQSIFLFNHRLMHNKKPLPVLSKGSLAGVDVTRFNLKNLANSSKQLRLELGLHSDNFVFTYIARKTRAKGALDILHAFSKLSDMYPDVRLLFVGPDEDGEVNELRNTDRHLFINVIDVGYVSNHEVYLAISDVLCLPSYREGFGSIVIEAAAMGIPTIGSRIPGIVDSVLDQETGILFPVGDVNELVNAMIFFINNREILQKMGLAAKVRVKQFFTADKLYFSLKQFYLESVKSSHNSHCK